MALRPWCLRLVFAAAIAWPWWNAGVARGAEQWTVAIVSPAGVPDDELRPLRGGS